MTALCLLVTQSGLEGACVCSPRCIRFGSDRECYVSLADRHAEQGLFSLMVEFRGRTNGVHCAVRLSTKATFVIHRRESSTATRSASQEEFASPRRQSKIGKGKCHEMLKSRLLPRYWSCRLSARLVQQTTPLFVALPATPTRLLARSRHNKSGTLPPTSSGFSCSRSATHTEDKQFRIKIDTTRLMKAVNTPPPKWRSNMTVRLALSQLSRATSVERLGTANAAVIANLLAKVEALLRHPTDTRETILSVGPLRLDLLTRRSPVTGVGLVLCRANIDCSNT